MTKFRGWKKNIFKIGKRKVFRIDKRKMKNGYKIIIKPLDKILSYHSKLDLKAIQKVIAKTEQEADVVIRIMKRTISEIYKDLFR